jgi:hypothetical protein
MIDIILDVVAIWFGACALFWLLMSLSCLWHTASQPARDRAWYREHASAEFKNKDGSEIRL